MEKSTFKAHIDFCESVPLRITCLFTPGKRTTSVNIASIDLLSKVLLIYTNVFRARPKIEILPRVLTSFNTNWLVVLIVDFLLGIGLKSYSWIPWKLVLPSHFISWKSPFLIMTGSGFYQIWLGREPQHIIFGKIHFMLISENEFFMK